ncbi:rhamnogalacturonan acetylesterase [Sunxiuqinia elliptica]|uniref:Lysophospholipase L1-like esterase n=1 Tax=Sunxiuqinia elliptica TaxID=655355 RepID=A0A4R6H687_9BACT|nr:rhamnogalacturonan acetylesterase [Sunxiuqinia elliptica]TDO03417.1 lysophospholipase L1-like esterase [Sunxiuqinia elliptica]TDO59613.1 lysophospholipase L1-like esterase [Sunxiuqinia elliptica]
MVRSIVVCVLMSLFVGCQPSQKEVTSGKPTVYLIGDSAMKNGQGLEPDGLWGWGDPFALYFDTTKITVRNYAFGITSSRTFRTKGLWREILRKLEEGDYVLIQFGHNETDPINDNFHARGTFDGISEKKEKINNLLTGEHEEVHTYGWYLRQYIIDAKSKGAIPVVLSPMPQNRWSNGKLLRDNTNYREWAREVAIFEEAEFIDLNEKMVLAMEALGEDSLGGNFFLKHEARHTSEKAGALAASLVVEGLNEATNCELKNYLLESIKDNLSKQ